MRREISGTEARKWRGRLCGGSQIEMYRRVREKEKVE